MIKDLLLLGMCEVITFELKIMNRAINVSVRILETIRNRNTLNEDG